MRGRLHGPSSLGPRDQPAQSEDSRNSIPTRSPRLPSRPGSPEKRGRGQQAEGREQPGEQGGVESKGQQEKKRPPQAGPSTSPSPVEGEEKRPLRAQGEGLT